MKRLFLITTPMLVTILISACGSSGQKASNGGGKASQASATTSSGGGGAYGGGYGGSSAGSSSSGSSSGSSSSGSSYGAGSSASNSSGGGASGSGATLVSTKHSKLGMILDAGSKQLTVYLFEGDKGSSSTCSGACASAWPPVTTKAKPASRGQAVAADLGTITRSDGTMQVTYKGHPLYFFVRDKDSGDAYGQAVKAFGAGWYTLAPSGKKIDNS